MKSLLNRKAVRAYILELYNTRRAHQISCVSQNAMNVLEAQLRRVIDTQIQGHPSIGKTFNP